MAMKRRKILGMGALALFGGGAVGTALGFGPLASNKSTSPEYLGQAPIVYERDQLHLRALQDAVRRGETITFEIEHTGRSETISLGCHIPWALQAYQDGQWRHVTWTEGRYYLLCYTGLSPGETVTESVPLSRSALAKNPEVGEVVMEISPGKYRFLLVGALPNLAVNFRVLPTE